MGVGSDFSALLTTDISIPSPQAASSPPPALNVICELFDVSHLELNSAEFGHSRCDAVDKATSKRRGACVRLQEAERVVQ